MSKYVDGFVLVVPKDRTEDYKKMAEDGRETWMKYGALEYFECKGDDLAPQEMGSEKTRSFNDMAQATDEDDVWFSFIVFESKEHRDQVNEKVHLEMEEKYPDDTIFDSPFDMTKLAYGGFTSVVDSTN